MKCKILYLTEEQVNYLRSLKNDNMKIIFWWENLQQRFEDVYNFVVLNGSRCFGYSVLSNLDEAIKNKFIKLL